VPPGAAAELFLYCAVIFLGTTAFFL